MAQSANFNTCDRIIRAALRNARLLPEGGDPSSELLADCMNRLNDLVNLWQTQGIKLWLNRVIPLTLVAGTGTYTLPTPTNAVKEMRVLEGYYVDQNGVSRPLDPLSWNTYGALSNKSQTGQITGYLADKQRAATVVSFWLVPDATAALGTVQFLVQDGVANLANLTDTMAFPNEWYMALHWGLADEICTGQPPEVVQRCSQRAKMYRDALEDWDVEDAPTNFAPNMDGQSSSFR